jgi:AbrB family looped-hinge helix DNA binding protein
MISVGSKLLVSFSVKGQVVIPRRLRKEFEIEEVTRVCILSPPDGILIKPVTTKFIRGLPARSRAGA